MSSLLVEEIPLKLVDSKASRLAGLIVAKAVVPMKTCSTVLPVCLKWNIKNSIKRDSL